MYPLVPASTRARWTPCAGESVGVTVVHSFHVEHLVESLVTGPQSF